MKKFAVTLTYKCTYGFVTYDEETKSAEVTIASEEAKKLVEDFFVISYEAVGAFVIKGTSKFFHI